MTYQPYDFKRVQPQPPSSCPRPGIRERPLDDFQFRTIPDGLPPSNFDATQDIPLLSQSISKNCLALFLDLIKNLNDSSDCPNDIRTFIRATDPDNIMLYYNIVQHENASRAKAITFNTYDELEEEVLEPIRSRFDLVFIGSNLWKEDMECMEWLDQRENDSVLYINFGSITPLSPDQTVEFAWGLSHSNHHFLWIIRPDMMNGKGSVLQEGFLVETKGSGLMVGWCLQEQVLAHPAGGGFLTHCGWNSTVETISSGVPMVCCPFLAEQQTTLEIEGDGTRGEVEKLVRVMMEGEKGENMRRKALEWKEKAHLAAKPGGSSFNNSGQS
ncbi:hypothetical protein Pfo_004918 [Paulownia fortunei]|nr:hypothetical protein Pfo_004918 [Paulownia fortunei]